MVDKCVVNLVQFYSYDKDNLRYDRPISVRLK